MEPGDLGPATSRAADVPTDEELDVCLAALKKSKAAGWDQIPIEMYQCSREAKRALFALVRRMWVEESVPADVVMGVFVPLYKNKGSSDDMRMYRFICLLTHAYKTLATLLLRRLAADVEPSLPESQAGFRPDRGCRDNILLLSWLIDQCVEAGDSMVVTFIDFAAAFDSVSHKFLDVAMESCGASVKCRAIFREIYAKASAVVRVRGSGGEDVLSRSFPVGRGVLQGDVFSPICFIVAVMCLVQRTSWGDSGVRLGAELLQDLWYADDGAILNSDVEHSSENVSRFAEIAQKLADMEVATSKTEAMHVEAPVDVGKITHDDIKQLAEEGVLTHVCSCGEPFARKQSLLIHQASCTNMTEKHQLDRILRVYGAPEERLYLCQWVGYSMMEPDATWEPPTNLTTEQICTFWKDHPELDSAGDNLGGEIRCLCCGKLCKSETGRKIHLSSCKRKPKKQVLVSTSVTVKAATRHKRSQLESEKQQVRCGSDLLKNVFTFKYLGHHFQADGDHMHAIEVRMAQARSRFGDLRHIWSSKALSLGLKLQLYSAAVCSMLVHGGEAWRLTGEVLKKVKNWNAKCLVIITGRSWREETVAPSFDLVRHLRSRRLRWLGHILRMKEGRLLRKVVCAVRQPYYEGSIFMDTPRHSSMDRLVKLASSRKSWNNMVNRFKKTGVVNYRYLI